MLIQGKRNENGHSNMCSQIYFKTITKSTNSGNEKISLLQLVSTVFCLCLIRIRVSTSKMLIPDPD